MIPTLYTDHDPIIREEIAQHGLYPCRPRRHPTTWRRVDRAQLAEDWAESLAALPADVRDSLPYQIRYSARTPNAPYHRSKPMPAHEVRRLVRDERRFAGWLGAAARFGVLRRLIVKTQSPLGEGSPRTTLCLRELHAQVSPGRLARRLRKIKARADKILAPYGLSVSWRALADVLESGAGHNRRIGRAALIAAAQTVTHHWHATVRCQITGEDRWFEPRTRKQAIAALIAGRKICRDMHAAFGVHADCGNKSVRCY